MPGPVQSVQPLAAKSGKTTADALKKASAQMRNRQLEKACQDFESLFIQHMMQQMRATVPRDGLFGGGSAEQIYTSMLDSKMAENISQQRGIGLAPILYRQLASATGGKSEE